MSTRDVHFHAADMAAAAARLDDLADRLETDLHRNESAVRAVAPAGVEEVSRHVAATLVRAAESHYLSVHRGVAELRQLAAVLRTHTTGLQTMDADNAARFTTSVAGTR